MVTKKRVQEANEETQKSVFSCLQDGCVKFFMDNLLTFIPRAMYRIVMQRSSPWVNLLAFAQLGYESYQSVGSISIFPFFCKEWVTQTTKAWYARKHLPKS